MTRVVLAVCILLFGTDHANAKRQNRASDKPTVVNEIAIARSTHHPVMNLAPLTRREVLCVALNIYFEARGSSHNDQIGVSMVVRNRAKMTQQSYCSVIWARHQFSWTRGSIRNLVPRDNDAWETSLHRAMHVVLYNPPDITGGATHFYQPRKVTPPWARRAVQSRRIGAHKYVVLSQSRRDAPQQNNNRLRRQSIKR